MDVVWGYGSGMPRGPRVAVGGVVYHVLNRANGRAQIFESEGDYAAFVDMMAEAVDRVPMRILAYCVMPNHWHMVVYPEQDGALSRYMAWLTRMHSLRWHGFRGMSGYGHLYQGRFKSFPVQTDRHFLAVCRYVERNAMRAGLVAKAEDWRWGSLWCRERGTAQARALLSGWPVPRPDGWLGLVNQPLTEDELAALRLCTRRGRPYGSAGWVSAAAVRLGLESTVRSRGRPLQT